MTAGSRIVALGHYQPARVVTNDDLAQIVDTHDAGLRHRVLELGLALGLGHLVLTEGDVEVLRAEPGRRRPARDDRLELTAVTDATAELGIAYLLAHQEVSTVIVGARNADQLAQNVKAVEWALTADERAEVEALAKGG